MCSSEHTTLRMFYSLITQMLTRWGQVCKLRERERERERLSMCMCVWEREREKEKKHKKEKDKEQSVPFWAKQSQATQAKVSSSVVQCVYVQFLLFLFLSFCMCFFSTFCKSYCIQSTKQTDTLTVWLQCVSRQVTFHLSFACMRLYVVVIIVHGNTLCPFCRCNRLLTLWVTWNIDRVKKN